MDLRQRYQLRQLKIINKIPGVHLDEPQEEAAANSEKADGNS
jgi:hypothetical protein